MAQWLRAAKRFEENSHEGNYFEAQSAIYALRRIQTLLETTFPQMFFLLGEPGSGKSFMLNHLNRLYRNKRLTILIENPFLTPAQLLQRLLSCRGINSDTTDIEALRLKAVEAYQGVEHLIMLDEAQLMSTQMREFIRILSDSKVFYFLIAMHKSEGEEMLSSAHFHSRPHQVIYLGDLEPSECMPYLIKELQPLEIWDVRELFNKNLVNQAWRYSNGNFRNFKKCFYHLFLFLDYAHTHNKKEFLKPNLLLLRMAAMRGRVLATQLNTDDFEELRKEAKGDKLSKRTLSIGLFSLLVVGAIVSWFLLSKQPGDALHVSQVQTAQVELEKEPKTEPVIAENEAITEQIELKIESNNSFEPTVLKENKTNEENIQKKETQETLVQEESVKEEEESNVTQMEVEKINQVDRTLGIEGALPLNDSHLPAPNKRPPIIKIQPYEKKEQTQPLQEQEPTVKQNSSLLRVKAGTISIDEMIQRFERQPSYDLALRIATLFYDSGDFVEASRWGRRANGLDKEAEAAWIIYAKSQYGAGFKEEAVGVLRLFLEYKNSQEALGLLQDWEKELGQ